METKEKEKITTVRISTKLRSQLKIRAAEKNTTQEKLLAKIVISYFNTPGQNNNKTAPKNGQ